MNYFSTHARRFILAALVPLLSVLAFGAAPAAAASSWWQVFTGARPTHLSLPTEEVQEIKTAGLLVGKLEVKGSVVGCLGSKAFCEALALTPAFPALETAAQVQSALEAAYGGSVAVTGGPVGGAALVVKTPGRFPTAVTLTPVAGSGEVVLTGGSGQVVVMATNLGETAVSGASTPVSIDDVLPQGVTATHVEAVAGVSEVLLGEGQRGPVVCAQPAGPCTFAGSLLPYERIEVTIDVSVTGSLPQGAEGEVAATVSGGEGGGAKVEVRSTRGPLTVSSAPTPFGVERYELMPEEAGGAPDTQAGSHPFQLTSLLVFNQGAMSGGRHREAEDLPPQLPKDLSFNLPPGLVGNATAVPQCTDAQFSSLKGPGGVGNSCPADTALGVAVVNLIENKAFGLVNKPVPLFNLTPTRGEPARFGFDAFDVPVVLNTSVRSGEDYGVTVSVDDITQAAAFLSSDVTFWGVPGDSRHDQARGWACLEGLASCASLGDEHPEPFLTLPTSCTGPLQTTMVADSWAQPGSFLSPVGYDFPRDGIGREVGLGGCNHLAFSPSISVAPDGEAGSTPTGLTVGVDVPQEVSQNPAGFAEADVKTTTVALPAGVQLSPSSADGLLACSNAQIGFEGVNPLTGTDEFTSDAPSCPDGSKVATVRITTPLLPDPLEGAVYLAAPQNFAGPLENPFGSLVAMYIVAEDPVSGVRVKLAGKVSPDPVSGQLVTTFEDTPQLPFEDLELHFFGSARAPLSTPASCGTYTTQASIAPWSGNAAAEPSSSFDITSGPNGAPCESPQPFAPGLQAGTTNLQAGGFTPFVLTMTRPDADQTLGGIEMQMPPGLLGKLSSVKLCGEPQASQGTCGAESLIGETVVSAGLGSDPYTVTGGKVYITTGYKGAPYGLSIVNPAKAGPFVLDEGRPVVVRAAIYVDPHTAALRILSDPLPTILDGIPLQIQHVNVNIDRPGFIFNPTNCAATAIAGRLSSSEGASLALSTPFQVTNCASLAFKPKFEAFTSAKTSRADGAALTVKLAQAGGGEANIQRARVELPKILPSRLSTLQKACTEAQFDVNPAGCPAESIVGHAIVHTPVLSSPLEGPAYFVSHGGAKFPELIMVLQGEGITIDLAGETFISAKGVTSTTLASVPDAPVSTFELTLPTGRFSALAANGNLCDQRLVMPTEFTGQNGAQVAQKTPIGVHGCSKALAIGTRSIKGRKLTVNVYAPAAGKVRVTGKGLSSQTKAAKGHETLKLTLRQERPGRLKTRLHASFTPQAGKDRKKQGSSVEVRFGR
ncbi:MAG TPA: hypothetical protein VGF95_13825 [Solirubrobacteraceae bacterium]|jgi:hypothetical protein